MGGGYFFSPIISTFVGDPFRSRPTQDFRGVNAGRFRFAEPSFPEVRGLTSARIPLSSARQNINFLPSDQAGKFNTPMPAALPNPNASQVPSKTPRIMGE
jgi:hypothetical protein